MSDVPQWPQTATPAGSHSQRAPSASPPHLLTHSHLKGETPLKFYGYDIEIKLNLYIKSPDLPKVSLIIYSEDCQYTDYSRVLNHQVWGSTSLTRGTQLLTKKFLNFTVYKMKD